MEWSGRQSLHGSRSENSKSGNGQQQSTGVFQAAQGGSRTGKLRAGHSGCPTSDQDDEAREVATDSQVRSNVPTPQEDGSEGYSQRRRNKANSVAGGAWQVVAENDVQQDQTTCQIPRDTRWLCVFFISIG